MEAAPQQAPLTDDNVLYHSLLGLASRKRFGTSPKWRLFTILSFEYDPRSVLEGGSEQRVERIFKLISECPLALHDLSESRMNTVLELRMFMAATRFGVQPKERSKDFLMLMPDMRQVMPSDLAGLDMVVHNMEPQTAMLAVANWLATRAQTRTPVPSAASLWDQYRRFRAELPRIERSAKMRAKNTAYSDVVLMIREWLAASGARGGLTIVSVSKNDS